MSKPTTASVSDVAKSVKFVWQLISYKDGFRSAPFTSTHYDLADKLALSDKSGGFRKDLVLLLTPAETCDVDVSFYQRVPLVTVEKFVELFGPDSAGRRSLPIEGL